MRNLSAFISAMSYTVIRFTPRATEILASVGEVKVVRSVAPEYDHEAIRVIKSLPKFTPGRQNGQPVRVWYTLPVGFNR